jgi:hypothetical protein
MTHAFPLRATKTRLVWILIVASAVTASCGNDDGAVQSPSTAGTGFITGGSTSIGGASNISGKAGTAGTTCYCYHYCTQPCSDCHGSAYKSCAMTSVTATKTAC